MCVAVVGQLFFCFLFFVVLAFVIGAGRLSVNTSVPSWALLLQIIRGRGGGHQPGQTSVQNKRQVFYFFFILSFVFLNGTHGFATVRCLWLDAWVFSWRYVTLLSICSSDWRKLWGSNVSAMFFSQTGQWNDTFAKTSRVWIFDIAPSFFASVCLM